MALSCLCVVHVGCGLSTCVWHLNDSTWDACQGLMLCDPLGMRLRRTSSYDTQVAGLRVDTTPDVDSSGGAKNAKVMWIPRESVDHLVARVCVDVIQNASEWEHNDDGVILEFMH